MLATLARITNIIILFCIVQGCVAINEPQNYRPKTYELDQIYYTCFKESHLPEASASGYYGQSGWDAAASSQAQAGYKLNYEMLERCMGAKGYNIRKPTTGETILGTLTFPLWLPIGMFSNYEPYKIGGGSGED